MFGMGMILLVFQNRNAKSSVGGASIVSDFLTIDYRDSMGAPTLLVRNISWLQHVWWDYSGEMKQKARSSIS
jgi:hypothetical protein